MNLQEDGSGRDKGESAGGVTPGFVQFASKSTHIETTTPLPDQPSDHRMPSSFA